MFIAPQATMPESPPKKRKQIFQLWRLLFFILVLVIFAAGGLLWFWKKHKRSIVKDNLQQIVSHNSKGLYNLSLGNLNFNEETGWVRLANVDLDYDSLRYTLLKSGGEDPPMLLRMKVGKIEIQDITSGAEMRDGIFKGRRMEILDPVLEIVYTGKKETKNIPSKEEIYKEITSGMDLELDSIILTNATIRTRQMGKTGYLVEAKGISVSLINVKVNAEGLADSSRIFFSKSFAIRGDDIHWSSQNKRYNYRVSGVNIGSEKSEISSAELSVKPVLGEQAFANAMPVQTDRCEFFFRNMRITKVDIPSLLNERLLADELLVGNAGFRIYRDLNRPPGAPSAKEFPQDAINHTPFRFKLRRIVVSNGYLEYKEKSRITFKPGTISFSGMSIVVNNFTNDPYSVKTNYRMQVEASGRFLNQVAIATHWTFKLMDPASSFSLSGSTGSLDGTRLNPILEPMGPAKIEGGMIDGVNFNLNGNKKAIRGSVTFLYTDLKVTLLEMDKGALVPDKKSLTSFLANILIKNDNPKKNKPPRVAVVDYPRTNNSSLFNYCWKALFKGLRASVGIKNK